MRYGAHYYPDEALSSGYYRVLWKRNMSLSIVPSEADLFEYKALLILEQEMQA